ncbi:hypothetical protein ACVNNN_02340 [Lysinibacillus fusiformis]|uniref:hypothetical protein n=1 Tax=Lysinibacillus sp. PWR01 TaxID=3342384 RepID=UPI00372D6B8F
MGRKVEEVPESILESLFQNYLAEYPTLLKIKAIDIFRYANAANIEGDFYWPPSYEYWVKKGRRGRQVLDEINIKLNSFKINEAKEYTVISTKDAFEEYRETLVKDKKKLISLLKINEVNLVKVSASYIELEEKYEHALNTIEELNKKITILTEKNKEYEQAIFRLMDISSNKEIQTITDFITTNNNRSKFVADLFADIFKDANSKFKSEKPKIQDNIIRINEIKKNNLIEELDL